MIKIICWKNLVGYKKIVRKLKEEFTNLKYRQIKNKQEKKNKFNDDTKFFLLNLERMKYKNNKSTTNIYHQLPLIDILNHIIQPIKSKCTYVRIEENILIRKQMIK